MALEAQSKYGPSALLTPSNAITVVRLLATPFFVLASQVFFKLAKRRID